MAQLRISAWVLKHEVSDIAKRTDHEWLGLLRRSDDSAARTALRLKRQAVVEFCLGQPLGTPRTRELVHTQGPEDGSFQPDRPWVGARYRTWLAPDAT